MSLLYSTRPQTAIFFLEEALINTPLRIQYFVGHEQEGQYLTVPFTMPPEVESLSLTYQYERYRGSETGVAHGSFTPRQEINIVDLGLIAPDGTQVGASGSDKTSLLLSETYATPGYRPCRLVPGEWQILLGAYNEEVAARFAAARARGALVTIGHPFDETCPFLFDLQSLFERQGNAGQCHRSARRGCFASGHRAGQHPPLES